MAIKHLFAAFLSLVLFQQSIAQKAAPKTDPTVFVIDDSVDKFDFWGTETTTYYEDTSRFEKFETIKNRPFKPTKGVNSDFGFSNSSFWLKILIKKKPNARKSWIIGSEFSYVDSLDYILVDDTGRVVSRKFSGRLVPHTLQEIPTHGWLFPLELPSGGVHSAYFRVSSRSSKKTTVEIYETHKCYSIYIKDTLFWASYFGLYIAMMLVQIIFYVLTKNRNSLYYLFYLLAFFFVELSRGNGMLGDRYLWPNSIWLKTNSMLLFVPIATLFGMWFYMNGLKLWEYSKTMYKILLLDGLFLTLSSLKVIFFDASSNIILFVLVLSLLSDLLVLAACFIVWKKGYKPARFYLIGTLFFFLGIIIAALWNLGVVPPHFLTNQSLNFGCIFEMIFFTAAIADEYKQNQEDKQRAQAEVIEVLETKNTEISSALLKGQTIERQRVAIDLHDNLGSTLSSLRFSMQAFDQQKLAQDQRELYQNIQEALQTAYNDVRLLAHNLLPEEFEKQGLVAALQGFVRKLNKSTNIHFDLQVSDNFGRIDPKIEFELYSICLELANNILKHSKASTAQIELSSPQPPKGALKLVISDNGIGLCSPFGGKGASDGRGLKNVRERVASINGEWEIKATENQGTVNKILVTI